MRGSKKEALEQQRMINIQDSKKMIDLVVGGLACDATGSKEPGKKRWSDRRDRTSRKGPTKSRGRR